LPFDRFSALDAARVGTGVRHLLSTFEMAEVPLHEQALMACPIDPETLASGHIEIVIPRMAATDEKWQ
jgi:hypothetical protein